MGSLESDESGGAEVRDTAAASAVNRGENLGKHQMHAKAVGFGGAGWAHN